MLGLSSMPSLPVPGCDLVQKQGLSHEVIKRKKLVNKCKGVQHTINPKYSSKKIN